MTEAEAAEAADGPEARRRWRGGGVGLAACTFGSRAYRPCRLFRRHHTRTALTKFRIAMLRSGGASKFVICFLVKRLSICVTYSCPPGTPFASLSARSHDDARAEKTRRTYDFRLAS
jgi:hypothetical protein